ncbi:MAG: aldo/keto reductase [Paraglaciecola sp.]|uniref:aldo/keto reductase n=1 Tax=Paraglaciecola sp. TaxID=1920173 RepID=UPI00273F8FB8|nr:aldo/keto reductase [Paraglaciecola sp.]MDP5029472.1 aldo/keto reductase [Paraglaciecola sp.]MDP5133059.1 aldo/keto reductase [Paraglaciecola sp.]
MKQRAIAGQWVSEIGLGCMNLSHAYGHPLTESEAAKVVNEALDIGVTHFDTAALYGFGQNELLLGKLLKAQRHNLFLASKCGMTGVDGKRVIDGRPATLRLTIEQALTSLQTDVLDLYYLHRWDKEVPIEDSVGELSNMVAEGKIKAIGLCEVSSATLRKAHAVHPIAALQTEYSLWTRNAEISVLETCKQLGTAFVAFSPLARGFLSGQVKDKNDLVDGDIRKGMPRFQAEHMQKNLPLLTELNMLSDELHCSMPQLALAWLLGQGEHIHPIPGTTNVGHLRDNIGASKVTLKQVHIEKLNQLFAPECISGPRYPAATQLEIDTEEF